ncbi:calcium-binding protein [Fretibacter rubidus]|uniref:calcium-binding protein n=1 Tax=Fretibacter rubidus TaxID=570162 RepID=UPI00352B45A7
MFSFELEAGQTVFFSGGLRAARMANIYDNNGNSLESASVTRSGSAFTATTSGTYFLEISGGSGNDYSFQFLEMPDDVASNQSTMGVLTQNNSVIGRTDSSDDVGWYAVNLTAGEVAKFLVEDRSFDLILFDSNGSEVASSRLVSGSTPNFSVQGQYIAYDVSESGQYFIAVDLNFSRTNVAYELQYLSGEDHGDSPASATEITRGQSLTTQFSDYGDVDVFAVTIEAGATLSLFLDSTSAGFVGASIRWVNGEGQPIPNFNDRSFGTTGETRSQGDYASFIESAVTQTVYAVIDFGGDDIGGEYTLSLADVVDDAGHIQGLARRIDLNQQIDARVDYRGDKDMFVLNLEAGTTYRIDFEGASSGVNGFVSFVGVTNEDNQTLSFNDNISYNDGNSLAVFITVETSGDYFFTLRSSDGGGYYPFSAEDGPVTVNPADTNQGFYTVLAKTVVDDNDNSFENAPVFTLGDTITGMFESPEDEDMFRIEITDFNDGDVLTTQNLGNTILSRMRLFDSEGRELANPRHPNAAFDVSNGIYYIQVTGASFSGNFNNQDINDQIEYAISLGKITDEAPGDFTTQVSLSEGNAVTGIIHNRDDEDWIYIDVEANDSVALRNAVSSSINFTIYDQNGNRVDYTSYSSSSDPAAPSAVVRFDEAGRYYIALSQSRDAQADYDFRWLSTIEDIAGDNFDTAFTFDFEATATPQTLTSAIDYVEDTDWFAITVIEGGEYEFTLNVEGLESFLIEIIQADGRYLADMQGDSATTELTLNYTFESAGTYYISIDSRSQGIADYTLTAILQNPPPVNPPTVDPVITGDNGDNILVGTDGNDEVLGQAGNDILIAGLGNDILTGGTGADKFVIGRAAGTKTILDFTASEDILELDYSPYLLLNDILDNITDFGTFIIIDMGDGTRIQLEGVLASDLDVDNFIFGTNHPDGPGPFLRDRYILDGDIKGSNGQTKVITDTLSSVVLPDAIGPNEEKSVFSVFDTEWIEIDSLIL